jgi:hypothetical protein
MTHKRRDTSRSILKLARPPKPWPLLKSGIEPSLRHLTGRGRVGLIGGLLEKQRGPSAQYVTLGAEEAQPSLADHRASIVYEVARVTFA